MKIVETGLELWVIKSHLELYATGAVEDGHEDVGRHPKFAIPCSGKLHEAYVNGFVISLCHRLSNLPEKTIRSNVHMSQVQL